MKTALRMLLLLFLATTISYCQKSPSAGKETTESRRLPANISAEELITIKKENPSVKIIDLRTPGETASGIIEGATIIDFNSPQFNEQISTLNKEDQYIVYCAAGGRSSKTYTLMKQLGFKNITEFSGGMSEWKKKGLPVVSAK